uniref:Uncharacterized protein n=1 Tax=Romanomermis culicivorax TaxID=13658 RepID=A0A915I6M8_ROMCU
MSDDTFMPVPVLDTSGLTANSVQSSAFSSPNKNLQVANRQDVIQQQSKNDGNDKQQQQQHNRSSYCSLIRNSKIDVLDSASSKKQHSTFSELLKVDTYRSEILSSERQEIRKGLHTMKSKIDGLESDKKRMAKNLEALRLGLDKYSDLLAKGNVLEGTSNRSSKSLLEANNGRQSSRSSRNGDILNDSADGRLDYDKLHYQLRALKEKATRAAANLSKEEKKAEISTGAESHSLLANVQELFSLLKRQNPALHQTALKMYETCGFDGLSSAENLIRNFGAELKILKKKAEKELKVMLRTYDEMSKDSKSEENIRKQNSLVAEMEQKDTYLQRLNCQIEWLKKLSTKTEPHKSTPVRRCRERSVSTPPAVGRVKGKGSQVIRHTVSSYQRINQQRGSTGVAHSHAKRRAAYFAKVLKEIRVAREIVAESGSINV